MAKARITFTDDPETGRVNVKLTFVPPARPGDQATPAQSAALEAMEAIVEVYGQEGENPQSERQV